MKMLPLLCCLFLLCGCSPQKSLAQRLKNVDCVVVTNTSAGLGFSITGGEVTRLIQAIAVSKKESPLIEATPRLALEVFKGAEHLETIVTSHQLFWIDHVPYRDTTGALESIYENYRQAYPPKP